MKYEIFIEFYQILMGFQMRNIIFNDDIYRIYLSKNIKNSLSDKESIILFSKMFNTNSVSLFKYISIFEVGLFISIKNHETSQ